MSKKRGGRGGGIANPKNFIANLRMSYEFSGKKRKAVWKFSKKNIHIWGDGHPLVERVLFDLSPYELLFSDGSSAGEQELILRA